MMFKVVVHLPLFQVVVQGDGTFYEITFNTVGAYYYFCNVHDASNMDGTINVTDTLGLDDIDQRDNFSIYPNPSIDELNFKLPESNDVINIEVFDVLGKKTHTTSIINSQKIDVKNWKNGVYFINVIYDEKRVTKVFIKN